MRSLNQWSFDLLRSSIAVLSHVISVNVVIHSRGKTSTNFIECLQTIQYEHDAHDQIVHLEVGQISQNTAGQSLHIACGAEILEIAKFRPGPNVLSHLPQQLSKIRHFRRESEMIG